MALLLNDWKYVMIKTVAVNRIDYYTFESQAARIAAWDDLAQYPKVEWILMPVNFDIAVWTAETVLDGMLAAWYNALKAAVNVVHTYTETPKFTNYTVVPGE